MRREKYQWPPAVKPFPFCCLIGAPVVNFFEHCIFTMIDDGTVPLTQISGGSHWV